MSSQNIKNIEGAGPNKMIQTPENFIGLNAPYCEYQKGKPWSSPQPDEYSDGGKYVSWLRDSKVVGRAAVLFAAGALAPVDRNTKRILLEQRKDDEEWTPPCGVVCPSLDSKQTARNKAESEVNIKVDLDQLILLGVWGGWPIFKQYPVTKDEAFFEKVIYLAYQPGLEEQTICLDSDTKAAEWFELDMEKIPQRHSPEMPEMIELIKKKIELIEFMEKISAENLSLQDVIKQLTWNK